MLEKLVLFDWSKTDMKKKSVSDPVGWKKKLTWATAKLFFGQKLQFHHFLK